MTCPLCQCQELLPFLSAEDNLKIAPGRFHIVTCQNCGLGFLHPFPSAEQINAYYPEDYCSRESQVPSQIPFVWVNQLEKALRNLLFQGEIRHIQKLIGKCGRILDVGCGSGDLLAIFKAKGYEAFGIELLPALAELAGERFGLDVRQGDFLATGYPTDYFDLVIFYHVLEHMSEPNLGLVEAKRILKKGGILLLQLPNIASFQFRIFKQRWFALELPRHLYHFSPKTIKLLLNKTGFDPFRVRHFSIRNNPLILASTLFPHLNYHRLPHSPGSVKMFCFLLALSLVPLTTLESLLGAGATMTITARSI
jgi:SAM-dependent methyltransferase